MTYSVTAKTSTGSRSGTLTIAGQTLTVTQSGRSAVSLCTHVTECCCGRWRPNGIGDDDQRMRMDRREQYHELDDSHQRKQRNRQRNSYLQRDREDLDHFAHGHADDRRANADSYAERHL